MAATISGSKSAGRNWRSSLPAVLGGVFREAEDAHGYFLLLQQFIRRYGLPAAVYTDRHGIFRRDPRTPWTLAEQLQGRPANTHVGRALDDLGIRWIGARSPQAKGRIERLFGTLQDRLVVELRLARACTLPQAQRVLDRFLPRFNARFAQAPAHPQAAWRPAPSAVDLDRICCFHFSRRVQQDNTVPLDGRYLQLAPGPHGQSYTGVRVDLHAHLDGTLSVSYRGQRVRAHLLPAEASPDIGPQAPAAQRPPKRVAPSRRTTYIPPADHPWRLSRLRPASAGTGSAVTYSKTR
jgi:hypothetical protein